MNNIVTYAVYNIVNLYVTFYVPQRPKDDF